MYLLTQMAFHCISRVREVYTIGVAGLDMNDGNRIQQDWVTFCSAGVSSQQAPVICVFPAPELSTRLFDRAAWAKAVCLGAVTGSFCKISTPVSSIVHAVIVLRVNDVQHSIPLTLDQPNVCVNPRLSMSVQR